MATKKKIKEEGVFVTRWIEQNYLCLRAFKDKDDGLWYGYAHMQLNQEGMLCCVDLIQPTTPKKTAKKALDAAAFCLKAWFEHYKQQLDKLFLVRK